MATPAPILCIEKERLILAYGTATMEHSQLASARITALINGTEPPSLERIEEAETRKENAKYAILAHQDEHGC